MSARISFGVSMPSEILFAVVDEAPEFSAVLRWLFPPRRGGGAGGKLWGGEARRPDMLVDALVGVLEPESVDLFKARRGGGGGTLFEAGCEGGGAGDGKWDTGLGFREGGGGGALSSDFDDCAVSSWAEFWVAFEVLLVRVA